MKRQTSKPIAATQVLGLATAAYSAALVIRPEILARPCGLTGSDGRAERSTRLLIRAIGARDTVIGTAMMLAPRGTARSWAVGCRIVADFSDAVAFGTMLPSRGARAKAAVSATLWGALCAAAAMRKD
ncbi:hypothetical protein WJ438_02960 [Streptomyces sp. GD-15H]|uniref:hypothetical protein n=1 Tax=Streptomyces sp. GD-15H TaxID=3129112 RepID=UPI0032456192